MKKTLTLLLAVIMLVSAFPISVYASFQYEHAVYGYSPNPDSTRLGAYADAIDWTDETQVAEAREIRATYHAANQEQYQIIEEGLNNGDSLETIARTVSTRRNEIRLEACADDPEGLALVKQSNLDTYGDENGPTPDYLYEKYGSWQTVIEKACSTNAGMDACLGFYDEYYYTYGLETDEEIDEEIPVDISDNGIPVVSLTIDEEEFTKVIESVEHEYRAETGSISITVPDGYTGEFSDTALTDLEDLQLEYIRGRGNSTWMTEKKPFKFKLKKSTNLLGMGKDKHWVLLASAFDNSLLRNRLTGYIGREFGLEFTPQFVNVDFVVNGEYQGSYVLAQQVRVSKTRVNIDELTPEDNEEPNVTGGYLLSLEPYADEAEENVFLTDHYVRFLSKSPEFTEDEDGTPEQRAYIADFLQKTENAIYGEDFCDENGVHYSEYMDVTSAAKYWLVNVIFKNSDAFVTPSTYLYKKRDTDTEIGKLYWGPLWDFDLAYPDDGTEDDFNFAGMEWLDYLRANDPTFQAALKEEWQKLDPIITDIVKDGGVLDAYESEIAASWEDNFALWKHNDFRKDPTTLEDAVEEIRTFVTARQRWVNENIDEKIGKVYFTVTYIVDDEVLRTEVNRCGIGGFALCYPLADEVPQKEGYILKGWLDENGNDPVFMDDMEDDITLYAYYISLDDAVFAEKLYLDAYEQWVDVNDELYVLDYETFPIFSDVAEITTESSDAAVVEADGKYLWLHGTGDADITVMLNGKEAAQLVLHIYDGNEIEPGGLESITPESDTLVIKQGETGQMKLSLAPQPAMMYMLEYTFEDETIADVDVFGVMTANAPGTTTVTVTDAFSNISAQFTLIVEGHDTDAYYAALAEANALMETDLSQYEDSDEFLEAVSDAQSDFAYAVTQADVDAATARIIAAIENLKKGYIEPEYKGTCNIVGLDGVLIQTNGEAEYEAQYDEKVYLLAPDADAKFAYTNADGSEIYAYLVSNVLYAPKNNTIFIKVVSEVTEGRAYIAGTSFDSETRKAKYNCQYSVPDSATDIETGIVMSFDKATTLELGAEGARAFKANKIGAQHEYSIVFNISDGNMGKTIYAKSYLTYTLNGETVTVYSDQHNIQLKAAD